MKNLLLIFTFIHFQSFTQTNANQFKWVDGANMINEASSYGASTNGPGARSLSVQWELNGKLYLFGGYGQTANATTVYLNDLWVYDLATNNWTWLKGYNGTTVPNSMGSYGTIGVASSTNLPAGRLGANSFTFNNKLYLMGGSTLLGDYNDLWEYDPIANNWTWIKGSNTFDNAGNYGTIGVETSTNVPGTRYSSSNWVANGKFYLFGGFGTVNGSAFGKLNDLWSYNPVTNNWTYIKGSMTLSSSGTYGTLGVAAINNTPGGRDGGNSWTFNNKLYFMGGEGSLGAYNDLWSFDIFTNNWTWLKGSSTINPLANFGSIGVSSSTNVPAAKKYSSTWTVNGKLYLFGASGIVTNVTRNDLWEYNPATNNWTWLKGDNSSYVQGQYGSLGVTASTNMPGGRYGGSSWVANNKLFLFGGGGLAATSTEGNLNELWSYDPMTNNFTWIKGRNVINKLGIYDAPLKPGARGGANSWNYNNKFYLMGGEGYDENGVSGMMNDLWEFNPATNLWVWLKGSKFANSLGSFGIFDVTAVTNLPRARQLSATWTYDNKLYLFGGTNGYINWWSDTWVFDISTNNWTWINGTLIPDVFGSYGTMGIENALNYPGSRESATAWTYNNKLYLFGGLGKGISGGFGNLNDLWEFNPASNSWLWSNGPNTINSATITSGSPNSIRPGSRQNAVSFVDNDIVYILGGYGYDGSGNLGYLNDLWCYNLTTKLFAFLKGSTTRNQFGVYGTQGIANSLNNPGARFGAAAWVNNKKFYLFSGYGFASIGVASSMNDLWEYKPSTNNWTWLKGSFSIEQGGSYGTKGVYNTSNIAGARYYASSFSTNNKIYLFGGIGYGSGVGAGYLNDLWEYTPACTETYSVASGNWNNANTWSCGQVPTSTDIVEIKATHIINLNNSTYTFKSLLLNGNITLGQSSGSLIAN